MTLENGATVGDVKDVNEKVETHESQDGAESNVTEKTELEVLKKELASRDRKINELSKYQKEFEEMRKREKQKELESKTTEERLAHYEQQLKQMEADAKISKLSASAGISEEKAKQILAGGDFETQANALRELIDEVTEINSKSAVEKFKQEHLSNVDKNPPKTSKENDIDAFTASMRRGAGLK